MKVYLLASDRDRQTMVGRFSKQIQLVGCSDLTCEMQSVKAWQNIDADCVVAFDNIQRRQYDQMNLPIPVVCYQEFARTIGRTPMDAYDESATYSTIVLGMSHAQCGLKFENGIGGDVCKMALPSMDLFLHRAYFDLLSRKEREAVSKVQNVILELPYYIFNYDLSRFGDFTLSKMKYFDDLNDYHNFGTTKEQQRKIEEYRLFSRIFVPLEEPEPPAVKKYTLRRLLRRIYHQMKIIFNRDKVWCRVYPETVKENVSHYRELISLIRTRIPNAKIHVLVMPFNPVFCWSHKKQVQEQRKLFYSCAAHEDISFVDDFRFFHSSVWFDDHCHLNPRGSERYSKRIAETLLRKVNETG